MRWIAILAFFLVLTGSALAAGSDEQYLDIYNEILQGDSLLESGHSDAAALRYLQAQSDLQKLHADHPFWNPDIVKFRLDYLADKLQSLSKSVPATNAPTAVAPAPGPQAAPSIVSIEPSVAALQHENAGLRDQIRTLNDANTELQGKLKEALTVQPAAVNPEELAKAEAKITMLQKERDLLTVALDQAKSANASAVAEAQEAATSRAMETLKARAAADQQKAQEEIDRANAATADSEKKLAAANQELESLKATRTAEMAENAALKADEKKAEDEATELKRAGVESEKALAALSKELELVKAAQPANVQIAEGAQQIPEERDQLKQQLAQISTDEAEITRLKGVVADSEQKLASANSELDSLKALRAAEAQPTDDLKAVSQERDQLKEELAERSKDLADAEANSGKELLSLRAELQNVQQQRDDLEKKLAAASSTQPATPAAVPENPAAAQQIEQLQAKVAALEATPVPYTPQELALLKKNPTPPPTAMPPVAAVVPSPAEPTNAPVERHVYSIQDLPPGSGALWADAVRASMEHDYDTAEEKFNDVLQQDETNVYVLDHLAEAQFANNHLDESEKTVRRAMSLDPNDPASLYLLGLLRYRQNRLDEALDALSMSAKLNPTNSFTQNYLGCVMAEKGMRAAAETAFRKSLVYDPDNADAHFNLAVIYAGDKPPSIELARWHYKRALALGHQRSATMDKLLTDNQ
jgi:Tfp pilus assembly protein PilF